MTSERRNHHQDTTLYKDLGVIQAPAIVRQYNLISHIKRICFIYIPTKRNYDLTIVLLGSVESSCAANGNGDSYISNVFMKTTYFKDGLLSMLTLPTIWGKIKSIYLSFQKYLDLEA